jgi:hypothetical protein
MEREQFRALKVELRRLGRRRQSGRFTYTDATIVEVYYWGVMHDRSTLWACQQENWVPGLRRGPLPSQPEMSRRLGTGSVQRLCKRVEGLLRRGRFPSLAYVVDGKAMPIAGHSRDRQAGYGRGAGGKCKGYKLHLILDLCGVVWDWRVAPMNTDERKMARRLLRAVPGEGYLLADANYDSNELFAAAAERGIQMVVPRRRGPHRNLAHRVHHPTRLRSKDLLENGVNPFGTELHLLRRQIERYFGTLTSFGGGLTCLPAWVRGHERVRRWVQAKLVINQLRANCKAARKGAA